MPLYEYECPSCGQKVEKIQPMSANPPSCPKCQTEMGKVIHPVSFKMKWGYPKWVDRIDDHQKKQKERGEKPTLPSPKEVL